MQLPTLTNTRLRSTADAHVVIHAARTGALKMIERRLDSQERAAIQVGNIYVWEERGALDISGMGIERWTDGIRWGPSRLRNDFLFYQQREEPSRDRHAIGLTPKRREGDMLDYAGSYMVVDEADRLIKQTYSVHVIEGTQSNSRRIKLHITAYFSRRVVDSLQTIDNIPTLRYVAPPPGMYKSARIGKPKSGETSREDGYHSLEGSPEFQPRRPETLPPIMVAGLEQPSSPLYDPNHRHRRATFTSYTEAPPLLSKPFGTSPFDDHSNWAYPRLNAVNGGSPPHQVSLPSLRMALASVSWSPTQRYAEDDLQLAKLDVARALV
ncbi:hypothetical protein CPB86DRAFT_810828 [Serendipita vermifera]|nr:hypothetical protein CPB86DRAFT_810828 [Serendipita vermifera]